MLTALRLPGVVLEVRHIKQHIDPRPKPLESHPQARRNGKSRIIIRQSETILGRYSTRSRTRAPIMHNEPNQPTDNHEVHRHTTMTLPRLDSPRVNSRKIRLTKAHETRVAHFDRMKHVPLRHMDYFEWRQPYSVYLAQTAPLSRPNS